MSHQSSAASTGSDSQSERGPPRLLAVTVPAVGVTGFESRMLSPTSVSAFVAPDSSPKPPSSQVVVDGARRAVMMPGDSIFVQQQQQRPHASPPSSYQPDPPKQLSPPSAQVRQSPSQHHHSNQQYQRHQQQQQQPLPQPQPSPVFSASTGVSMVVSKVKVRSPKDSGGGVAGRLLMPDATFPHRIPGGALLSTSTPTSTALLGGGGSLVSPSGVPLPFALASPMSRSNSDPVVGRRRRQRQRRTAQRVVAAMDRSVPRGGARVADTSDGDDEDWRTGDEDGLHEYDDDDDDDDTDGVDGNDGGHGRATGDNGGADVNGESLVCGSGRCVLPIHLRACVQDVSAQWVKYALRGRGPGTRSHPVFALICVITPGALDRCCLLRTLLCGLVCFCILHVSSSACIGWVVENIAKMHSLCGGVWLAGWAVGWTCPCVVGVFLRACVSRSVFVSVCIVAWLSSCVQRMDPVA